MAHTLIAALLGLWVWAVLLVWSPESLASILCRNLEGQQVCIETIKRSAKYTWEYRVVISVDGKSRPVKRYDCRKLPQKLNQEDVADLSEAALQQFICGLVSH